MLVHDPRRVGRFTEACTRPDIRARRSTWGSLAYQLLGIADPPTRESESVACDGPTSDCVTCIFRQDARSPRERRRRAVEVEQLGCALGWELARTIRYPAALVLALSTDMGRCAIGRWICLWEHTPNGRGRPGSGGVPGVVVIEAGRPYVDVPSVWRALIGGR